MICGGVSTFELNERYISAVESPVFLTTTGSCDSRGSWYLTWLIFDSTSATARSALALSRRFRVIVETFCCEFDTSVSMPSAEATAWAIGVVMKPLIRSALAPG